ncbi:phage portal protein, partial [Escherichia coli]|nr:phage portal protein [Escherichia coli]
NGYAANAIQLHQDHIVGSFFRLSHRPSWRYLGIGEEEVRPTAHLKRLQRHQRQ